MEDNEIIELYWRRSEQAIQESGSKYGSYCLSIANNILSNLQDSEECVNSTWLNARNAIPPQRPNRLSAFFAKITRNLSSTKAPASDVSQDANVQNNNSGMVGGYCISDQNKNSVTVPKANYELDFDKDGTISSADYKLSGMSQDDFASKLVSNGNVGTASEAKQVIKGDITVMCGVFSGTRN